VYTAVRVAFLRSILSANSLVVHLKWDYSDALEVSLRCSCWMSVLNQIVDSGN